MMRYPAKIALALLLACVPAFALFGYSAQLESKYRYQIAQDTLYRSCDIDLTEKSKSLKHCTLFDFSCIDYISYHPFSLEKRIQREYKIRCAEQISIKVYYLYSESLFSDAYKKGNISWYLSWSADVMVDKLYAEVSEWFEPVFLKSLVWCREAKSKRAAEEVHFDDKACK
jgi:hypothetical protein